jgi:hypothetical protein
VGWQRVWGAQAWPRGSVSSSFWGMRLMTVCWKTYSLGGCGFPEVRALHACLSQVVEDIRAIALLEAHVGGGQGEHALAVVENCERP